MALLDNIVTNNFQFYNWFKGSSTESSNSQNPSQNMHTLSDKIPFSHHFILVHSKSSHRNRIKKKHNANSETLSSLNQRHMQFERQDNTTQKKDKKLE